MNKKTIGLFLNRNKPDLPYLFDEYALYIYSSDKNVNDLKSKADQYNNHSINELYYKFLIAVRYDEIKRVEVNLNYVSLITTEKKISIILKRSNSKESIPNLVIN